MATKQKRISRFNFKKVFASLFILAVLLLSSVIIISDNVKGEYTDEATTLGSYIAWITLYDTSGNVIVNWTSVNDDVSPNVNSQNTKIGYWSIGVYILENDSTFGLFPYNGIKLFFTLANITEDLTWYINEDTISSYLSSYTDYGYYDIVNLKTPDWQTQMTYDWWRLDNTLTVNATLYLNPGNYGVVQDVAQAYTTSSGATWNEVHTTYDALFLNASAPNTGFIQSFEDTTYSNYRSFWWYENDGYGLDTTFQFTAQADYGSDSQIYFLVYDAPVNNLTFMPEYYDLSNWNMEPFGIISEGEIEARTPSHVMGPFELDYNASWGNYILIMGITSLDALNLGVLGDEYLGGRVGNAWAFAIYDNWTLSYSFTQDIVNHEQFSLDVRSIVWLLIGLLPSAILGFFIGRPGVLAGLAIMAFVIGFTQTNYFWVMGLTLGICGIMLYRGGVR